MTAEGSAPASEPAAAPRGTGDRANHWGRLVVIWVIVSVAADVLWIKLVGPHVPPGRMSNMADGAAFDFNVLIVLALPVLLGVWVYLLYAVFVWRASKGGPDPVATKYSRGNPSIEWAWIILTTVLVLFLAGFGTYELVQPGGAGGGQGPNPIWTPTSHNQLEVQVIGQQWKWTYRYPQFGGFETNELLLPVNQSVAFNVTSLDVIHSFWAYQLGVKADANPGYNNVAFTTPIQTGYFVVRCGELCGLWHGAMYNEGRVVTATAFDSWAKATEKQLAENTKLLPPYAPTYTPDANGADGSYYPDTKDPYSPVEMYGATQPAGGA
jgi:cytochrome c oxidase subunit 2